jgi:methylenetetrahydrofolate dehydrogenase (NADP+)/methenyltetrahydrofolate cyclohydrolase
MILLSGKTVRDELKKQLSERVGRLSSVPELAIIQIGVSPESYTYVEQKKKFGQSVGINVRHLLFDEDVAEEVIISKIEELNHLPEIGGIIVQLPIPKNLNKRKILDSIFPEKDVDGLGSVQEARLLQGDQSAIIPATARGILTLLEYYEISLSGKKVVVVGRSDLVGKPVAMCFLNRDATVTVCHSKTRNLPELTKMADILVVACGARSLIDAGYVCSGQVVVDVGIHKTDGGFVGDCDFEKIKDIVSAITPVPGGVGPMTVVSLFQNLVDAAEMAK